MGAETEGDKIISLSKRIGGSQAFPLMEANVEPGMTYREWLIGMALSGAMGRENVTTDVAATWAVDVADTVLRRLARQEMARQ